MSDLSIVNNIEEICFEQFISRLLELHRDCNHEHYLAEVFMPFLRMCCIDEKMKIVPIYDDRNCGPKTKEQTEAKKRMETICAPKQEQGYVVPDYIFVAKEYSFTNPLKPYLMVETKNPVFIKEEKNYRPLSDYIKDNKTELLAEIRACKYVLFTDGITWMFLTDNGGEIIENENYPTISLVDFHKKYHKTYEVTAKKVLRHWI